MIPPNSFSQPAPCWVTLGHAGSGGTGLAVKRLPGLREGWGGAVVEDRGATQGCRACLQGLARKRAAM